MPLAAAERGGHSLHPHTARLSLPLSLSISRSVCLCLSCSPRVCLLHFPLHSATACHCFSPLWTIFSAVFLHLPITLSHTVILLFILLRTNFYFAPFLFTLFSFETSCAPRSLRQQSYHSPVRKPKPLEK